MGGRISVIPIFARKGQRKLLFLRNLIWENDIVKDLFSDACAQIKYGSYQSCFDSTKTEHVGFYVDWSGKYTKRYRKDLGYWTNMVNAEVIGNIFDNPELLEVWE